MTKQFWARILCPLPLSSMVELCNAAPKGSYVRNIGKVSFEGITREVFEIGPEIPGEAIPQRTARLFADAAQLELRLHNLLDDLQGPLDLDLEGRIIALHERVSGNSLLEQAIQLQLSEWGVPFQAEKGDMDLSERLEWIAHALFKERKERAAERHELQTQRDEARAEAERLKEQILEALCRCNPYVSLQTQRDVYQARAEVERLTMEFAAANSEIEKLVKESDEACAELAELREVNAELREDEKRLLVERDEARVEANRLTNLVSTLTHRLEEARNASTRPEPSRLEIAAMIYAAWNANSEVELVRQTGSDRAACFEPCGAVEEADALIAATEGRCSHDSH